MRIFKIQYFLCSFFILFSISPTVASAQFSCLQILENKNIFNELEAVNPKLRSILRPVVLMSSLVGKPPQRHSIQSVNYSHFGELAEYRPVFFKLMREILIRDHNSSIFRELSAAQQRQVVSKFIESAMVNHEVDNLGRNFFVAYLEKWIYQGFKHDHSNKPQLFFSLKKNFLKNPRHIEELFSDFFVQFFRFAPEHLDSIDQLIEATWGLRGEFQIQARHNPRLLNELSSFNPVGEGSSRAIKRFSRTAGSLVFELISIQGQIVSLETQILGFTKKASELSEYEYSIEHSRLLNEIISLLTFSESVLSMRQVLHSEILNIFSEQREKLTSGVWRFIRKKKHQQNVEKTLSAQHSFSSSFRAFEELSTFQLMTSLTQVYKSANEMPPPKTSVGEEFPFYAQVLKDRISAIEFQKTILAASFERFRSQLPN